MRIVVFLAGLLLLLAPARAETVSPDETARFLAGLPLPAASPLSPLAATPVWKQHAAYFDASFDRAEKRQLAKIRAWAGANLAVKRGTLFYLFSGPDYLYANAFFPDASTYVLAGLEPTGEIPDLSQLPRGALPQVLGAQKASLGSILNISFFLTNNMKKQLRASPINGTLPVLYVFITRAGKTIREASLVHVDENGEVQSGKPAGRTSAPGVKIVFAGPDGREQTLYYFSTNLSNDGFKNGAFAKFLGKQGEGNAFVKSASYLMHNSYFSEVRQFLLDHSSLILQDDSGIPVTAFDPAKWELRPWGRYLGPIALFSGRNQPKLRELFQKGSPGKIDFGVGYRWRPNESNLLVATRKGAIASQ